MKEFELIADQERWYVRHNHTGNLYRVSTLNNLSDKFKFSESIRASLQWLKRNHPELLL